jgi:hypothetical protein
MKMANKKLYPLARLGIKTSHFLKTPNRKRGIYTDIRRILRLLIPPASGQLICSGIRILWLKALRIYPRERG